MLSLVKYLIPIPLPQRGRALKLFEKEINNSAINNATFAPERLEKIARLSNRDAQGLLSQSLLYSKLIILIADAGYTIAGEAVVMLCMVLASAVGLLAVKYVTFYLVPLLMLGGFFAPITYLQSKADKRAMIFLSDYPSILLAIASYMKAGLSLYPAMEKSAKLFSDDNLVAQEIKLLLEKVSSGVSKEHAILSFAEHIRLPELELFRQALLLAADNGGKFVPTLYRLAVISKDRANLIVSAKSGTAAMKLTANVLLVVTPLLLLFMAARIEDFWTTIVSNGVANALASTGAALILFNYILLRRMSNFRP